MMTRVIGALAIACALLTGANAAPLSNVADVAMKRHCIPNNIRCRAPLQPVCVRHAGPDCCLQWGCRRPHKGY